MEDALQYEAFVRAAGGADCGQDGRTLEFKPLEVSNQTPSFCKFQRRGRLPETFARKLEGGRKCRENKSVIVCLSLAEKVETRVAPPEGLSAE